MLERSYQHAPLAGEGMCVASQHFLCLEIKIQLFPPHAVHDFQRGLPKVHFLICDSCAYACMCVRVCYGAVKTF